MFQSLPSAPKAPPAFAGARGCNPRYPCFPTTRQFPAHLPRAAPSARPHPLSLCSLCSTRLKSEQKANLLKNVLHALHVLHGQFKPRNLSVFSGKAPPLQCNSVVKKIQQETNPTSSIRANPCNPWLKFYKIYTVHTVNPNPNLPRSPTPSAHSPYNISQKV